MPFKLWLLNEAIGAAIDAAQFEKGKKRGGQYAHPAD